MCVGGAGFRRKGESDRGSETEESPFTGCHSRLVSVKKRKLSLLDRCLLTGLSRSMLLTLSGKNFIVPEKEHN